MNTENTQQEQEPFVPKGADAESGAPTSTETFTPTQEIKTEITYKDEGWSWGGFAFNLMFAVGIRRYVHLWLLLLFLIPIVNIFVGLGIMIYFGVKGREMARTSKTFSNKEQYLGFMKAIDNAGKILSYFYIAVVVAIIALIAVAVTAVDTSIDRDSGRHEVSRVDETEQTLNQLDIDFNQQ